MLGHLTFDTTDATSKLDSSNVGAYLRDAAGNLITSQANGGQQALDVGINVAGVQIDPRSIRALTNVDVVTVEQGTSPWTVDGTVELGATTLAALESITVQNGAGASAVNIQDGGNSITVDAVDLDIRNLDYSQDNVAIKGATGNQLVVNADGSLNVNADISITTGSDKAEDAASVSGDIGTYVLAVRQDTLASSTSADGDFASFKVSAAGALYVNLAESSGTISVNDAALANTAAVSNSNTLNVANTAEPVVASPLTNRKYLSLFNYSGKEIYIGGAGVTEANGFPVSPGTYIDLRAGAAAPLNFVGRNGLTPEIRTLELS